MARITKRRRQVRTGTFKYLSYRQLKSNPLNPRRLFDKKPLSILKESIRSNGILVPLTVYQEGRTGQHYILDGERRWRCAERIETAPDSPMKVRIPVNVVDPPTRAANLLWMFNIHNLREKWDLMPTALSLEYLMEELGETDERKLAKLTQLSESNVRHCKVLLSYPQKYQMMMVDPDEEERIKPSFFLELSPVLDVYKKLPKRCRAGKTRDRLTDHFLGLYKRNKIRSVIHFRRILEAHEYVKDDPDKWQDFLDATAYLSSNTDASIVSIFSPLIKEEKTVHTAEKVCKDFLTRMRRLKLAHISKRYILRKQLVAIKNLAATLLEQLGD